MTTQPSGPTADTTPDTGSTSSPDTGPTSSPDARSTSSPDTGSTSSPDARSMSTPDTGSTSSPDTGSTSSPDARSTSSQGARPGPVRDRHRAWRRLLRAGSPRRTRANALAMLLAGALGFAIIAQVRQTSSEGLENLREDELVRIFAGVDQDGERLADEIRDLESSLALLQSQSTNEVEAQRAAQQRLDALGILAGTSPATGPGIVLTIRDPELKYGGTGMLDTVQELRDAGAEAIQIGDVRVVADTWFSQTADGISVSGTEVRPPYVVRAIGDADTLAGALEIPGGVSATVRSVGGSTDTRIEEEVEIDALLTLAPPQYARPVPTSTP